MERLTFITKQEETTVYANDWPKVIEKLAEYEDAEQQRRLLISDHRIGDRMYAIVHDDIHDTYDISKHRITDICMSGTIITDGPIGDDLSETWTKKDQEFYHVCFSMEEAEKKKMELEANNGTVNIL